MTTVDWQLRVVNYLIDGGTTGRKQSDVQNWVTVYVRAAELVEYLNILWMEGKVQRFQVPHAQGTGTVWRATTKILEN